MDMEYYINIYILTVILILSLVRAQQQVIQFSVIEQATNTFAGDISSSSLLKSKYQSNELQSFKYEKSLNPNQDQTLFSLNRDTGIVRTAKSIDREQYCAFKSTCYLYLDVTIAQPVAYIQVLTLEIEILDENDNAPTFDQGSLDIQITESAPIGTKRVLYEATDRDSPANGVDPSRYVLQSNLQGPFDIQKDTTGLYLVLKQNLDRETTSNYSLKLLAYDKGTPPKSSSLDITITVKDANDHSPVFSQTMYQVQAKEDFPVNKTLIQVSANDKDVGINAQISYSLATLSKVNFGNIFGVNESSGSIYLKSHLDYETQSLYQLEVLAKDKGTDSKTATCTVDVTVIDVNDNTPQVQINTLTKKSSAEIMENLPNGTFVAFVTVSDGDSGINGRINCILNHPSFQLEALQSVNQFKITTKGPLDRETKGVFTISVICSDLGSPQLQGVASISVVVLDQNDHSPKFNQKEYTATVPENSGIGAYIVQVSATDNDIGSNGKVTYSITDATKKEYVNIVSNDGILKIAKKFDYETFTELVIPVTASDGGDPPKTDSATVKITVTDVNDQPPKFNQTTYNFKISEQSSPRTLVGKVKATDPDSNSNNAFVFSIDQKGDATSFDIDPASGQISTNTYLDRELKDIYNFLVYATDQKDGYLSTSANIIVKVLDENDNAPTIIYPVAGKNSTIEISNHVPVGYRIMQISATDADIGLNGNLSYVLYDNSGDSKTPRFTIDKYTGVITTNKDLTGDSYKVVTPTIVVRDHGKRPETASTTVTIVINSSVAFGSKSPSTGEQNQEENGNSNLIIIITLSVITGIVVVVLVIAIVLIKNDRRAKNQKSLDNKPEQDITSSSPAFTTVPDNNPKDGEIPILFPGRGIGTGIPNPGLDTTGSDDTLNNSNSNDSGKGPSEGDGAELQHVGVKRIDSGRQRPMTINPNSVQNNYQPMMQQQQPSPESYSSSPSYQPIEPFFPTSSPITKKEFNYETDYVAPSDINPSSHIMNNGENNRLSSNINPEMLSNSGGSGYHGRPLPPTNMDSHMLGISGENQHMSGYHHNQMQPDSYMPNHNNMPPNHNMHHHHQQQHHNMNHRHSAGPMEQWQNNVDMFAKNNPQADINNMLRMDNSHVNPFTQNIDIPQSPHRQSNILRQYSAPAQTHDYLNGNPQYIHMNSVPNGNVKAHIGGKYSVDV